LAANARQGLGGVNTYTGATTVGANAALLLSFQGSIAASSGLNLAGAGATFDISATNSGNKIVRDLEGVAGSFVILGNRTLVAGTSNSTTFAGVMSGSALSGFTKQGSGTMILTANNTYGGNTTISGGILQLGNGGTTGMIAGNVVNNGVLAFNRSDNITFAGDISGSGAVAYMGPGIGDVDRYQHLHGRHGDHRRHGAGRLGCSLWYGRAMLTLSGGTMQATAELRQRAAVHAWRHPAARSTPTATR
jgi:fibronectin-binding autotransporter adhesin